MPTSWWERAGNPVARRNNGMNGRRLLFWLAVLAVAGLAFAGIDRASLPMDIPGGDLGEAAGFAGLGLAAVAAALAWLAWRQRNQLRREVSSLQAAVDRVMNDRAAARAARSHDDPPRVPVPVATLPWHAIAKAAVPSPGSRETGADSAAVAGRLRTLLDSETLTISLRPIVSLGEERPVAFDAFARVEPDGVAALDMRRLAARDAMLDAARFERLAIVGSMKAARRLGDGATVHASASAALLSSAAELEQVIAAAAAHPRAARSVALDLAPEDARRPGPHADAVDRLEQAGLTIGLDLAAASAPLADDWPRLGIAHARVPAAMLLGRDRHHHIDGRAFVGLCGRNGIAIIADDIDGGEALVAIAESGIDLVTGDRFGRPRPLRRTEAGDAAIHG